jgi:hypothetical protein
LQAILFAMAHGGYGTWVHVLLPLAFALLMGVFVVLVGVWGAVVVHFLIDLYVFGSYVAAGDAVVMVGLWLLLSLNAAATLAWLGEGAWRWSRGGAPPWRGFVRIEA